MSEQEWVLKIARRGRQLAAMVSARSAARTDALRCIRELDDAAWKDCPNAEPDGDLTYATSTAASEIEKA